ATGFATIINGGHRIQPYFIERIYNFDNETIYQANPQQACALCFNENLSATNAKLLELFEANKSEISTDTPSAPAGDRLQPR
ncbi:hypothetical protein, partial [Streptococcus pneumoniae]